MSASIHSAQPDRLSSVRREESTILTPQEYASKRLIHRGILTYTFGLLAIAALAIAFHYVTDSIVQRESRTAAVVNMAGRQRMLCQRISRLALERAAHTTYRPDSETQAVLLSTIAIVRSSNLTLLQSARSLEAEHLHAPSVLDSYLNEPNNLEAHLQDYLAHASRLATRPNADLTLDDPDLRAVILAVQAPLLNALDNTVSAIQQASEASVLHLRHMLQLLTLAILAALALEAIFLYRPLFNQLERSRSELARTGRTDPLTGCLNRRGFTYEAENMLTRARAAGTKLSIMMLDIDKFKSINDRYGHTIGDAVITDTTVRIRAVMRKGDLFCRMGGEEFAIVMRAPGLPEALKAADHYRRAVALDTMAKDPARPEQAVAVTISIGVAMVALTDATLFDSLGRADKALYRAKLAGRNCVEPEILTNAEPAGYQDSKTIRAHKPLTT